MLPATTTTKVHSEVEKLYLFHLYDTVLTVEVKQRQR